MAAPARASVVDALGEELTSLLTPVSVCMLVTVVLVKLLTPSGEGGASTEAVAIATLYYDESAADPVSTKLLGSVVNALLFVLVVGALTFVLVLLFKYGCARFIWAYMGFAGLQIFAVLGGIVWLQLFERARAAPGGDRLDVDALSFGILLWNFSVVGVLAVFFWPLPLLLKQAYLVYIAAITAFWFTKIPAWSTWTMLVMMAVYDIVAVLTPGGPLKMLVDIASERQEELPALVYEANPEGDSAAVFERASGARGEEDTPMVLRAAPRKMRRGGRAAGEPGGAGAAADVEAGDRPGEGAPPPPRQQQVRRGSGGGGDQHGDGEIGAGGDDDDGDERSGLLPARAGGAAGSPPAAGGSGRGVVPDADGGDEWEIPGGAVKLGLGDFIFYSVLVGRAAMYDSLTMFSCYFAIVAGLGITFLLLALHQRALPALPFSIALGVAFYFLTRAFMEQIVVGLSVAGAAL